MITVLTILLILIAAYVVGRRAVPPGSGSAARPARKKPVCKWRKTGDGKGRMQEFRCDTCGAVGYSTSSTGPLNCKRNLGGGDL